MRSFQHCVLITACAAGALPGLARADDVPPATFLPRVSRPVGGPALWTAAADFDGDGRTDVAVGSNGSRHITTFYTQPDGTLPLTGSTTATTGVPTRLSAGDFNADGRADLIYLDDNSGMKLTFGQPDNTFGGTTPITFPNGASFWGRTTVGDLNHDGRLDAMIAYATSTVRTGRVVTSYALPGGGFSSSSFGTNSDPYGIANADLNGDDYPDIIIADNSGEPIKVAYGSESGTFTLRSFGNAFAVGHAVVQDFNGDGIPDVAASRWSQPGIGIMLTGPNGDLGPVSFTPSSAASDLATGDFNGDQIADLVGSSAGGNSVTVLLGNGDGSFGSAVNLNASANGSSTVSVADLDGNGFDDIAVAAASGQNLDIFYAVPEPGALAPLAVAALTRLARRRRPSPTRADAR